MSVMKATKFQRLRSLCGPKLGSWPQKLGESPITGQRSSGRQTCWKRPKIQRRESQSPELNITSEEKKKAKPKEDIQ